ncbi:MAG: hypothetical protein LBS52_02455 [Dysgonamonadaceae bacterium]|nr:hypothetical protein [Dysgonamonadaceae bacterium]
MGVLKKQLKNPAFGLLPLFLFSIGMEAMSVNHAVLLALGLSVVGFLLVKKYSRLIYDISLLSFSLVFLLSFLFSPQLNKFLIFCLIEVFFVLSLIFLRLYRSRIVFWLGKDGKNRRVKNYIGESFRVAVQTQYGLSIHLIVILLYFVFYSINKPFIPPLAMTIVLQIIVLWLILKESLRIWLLDRTLCREEWLPVVNQEGVVVGRVAKSVTKGLMNKFMHPVVRVALIFNGKIYLKKRDACRVLNPGLLDYPFEKYMQFDHNLDDTVHNSVKLECGSDGGSLRFLLKYTFENASTKRLIFLYVSVADDEAVFDSLHLKDGKLWTMRQIEDNLGLNVFSECFEMEYEYLKNTVLLAYRMKEKEMMMV